MEKEWNIIEVLRHSRHDWLNKLQLIKGNLDLNRIDRAKAIIDEIVVESQNESRLSNLQLPAFAALLMKANWENYLFQVEYEILEDTNAIRVNERELVTWANLFFDSLNASVAMEAENLLAITIVPLKEGARFFFDFRGIIKEKERIEQFLIDVSRFAIETSVKEFTEHELAVEVYSP
ncbi:Spo0B C-terminal domain-containing protein [Neobacillus sp. SM06]|uniref:Spo0B C-terminal domain-containing protein n=1 Tax=Neobacillus sp. SM06 TaxID=3422492 RepID=UPI003D2D9053